MSPFFYLQATVYKAGSVCAAFLANIDGQSDKTVTFNGKMYKLPAWSVSILPDCKNVVLNTAQVYTATHNLHLLLERKSTVNLIQRYVWL
jgi:hypothetical protein